MICKSCDKILKVQKSLSTNFGFLGYTKNHVILYSQNDAMAISNLNMYMRCSDYAGNKVICDFYANPFFQFLPF